MGELLVTALQSGLTNVGTLMVGIERETYADSTGTLDEILA